MLKNKKLEQYKKGIFNMEISEMVSSIKSKLEVDGFLDRKEAYMVADILAQALFSPVEETRETMRKVLEEKIWSTIEYYQMLEVVRKACWGNKEFQRKWENEIKHYMGRKEFVKRTIEDYRQNIYTKEVR